MYLKRWALLGLLATGVVAGLACGSSNDNKASNSTAAVPAVTQAANTPAAGTSAAASATPAGGYQVKKVASSVTLTGAGATFPNPLYSKAFDEYNKKVDSNVKVNYQSIGSSGGIKNFTEKTVDFGASDAFMTDKQLADAGGAEGIFHIPTALGAVVMTYNLPGFNGTLRFSPELLVDILNGDIKKWNDAKIKAENSGASLPDAEIAVIYRSDGSGTTSIFTNYLSSASTKWKDAVGAGTSVKWPTGIGASGNEGVTGQVKQTPGALGYVELIYAEQNKLPTVEIKNKAGKYVKPTLKATSAAAADLSQVPADLRANIVNASGDDTYPISGFTWILVYRNQTDELKANALVNMLWWLTHDGQSVAANLQYAPLPQEIVAKLEPMLKQITVGGKPVIGQ